MFIMKRDMRQVHTWHSSWWIFLINIWIGHGNYNVFKVHWLRHIFNTFFCWILWATFISAFLFWFKSSKWALGCAYLRCLCTFRKSCAAYKKFERVKVNFSSSFNFNAITISWLLVFTYSVNCSRKLFRDNDFDVNLLFQVTDFNGIKDFSYFFLRPALM